jgi:hypothetical protein
MASFRSHHHSLWRFVTVKETLSLPPKSLGKAGKQVFCLEAQQWIPHTGGSQGKITSAPLQGAETQEIL